MSYSPSDHDQRCSVCGLFLSQESIEQHPDMCRECWLEYACCHGCKAPLTEEQMESDYSTRCDRCKDFSEAWNARYRSGSDCAGGINQELQQQARGLK